MFNFKDLFLKERPFKDVRSVEQAIKLKGLFKKRDPKNILPAFLSILVLSILLWWYADFDRIDLTSYLLLSTLPFLSIFFAGVVVYLRYDTKPRWIYFIHHIVLTSFLAFVLSYVFMIVYFWIFPLNLSIG